jgi:hypothetical protein
LKHLNGTVRLAAALLGATLLQAAPAAAYEAFIGEPTVRQIQSHYYVYCANGKIEVDGRDPNQMRIARGSGVCMLSRFGFLSDAQSFRAEEFRRRRKALQLPLGRASLVRAHATTQRYNTWMAASAAMRRARSAL